MGAMYGKTPLCALEIQGSFSLSNGMYCVYGKSEEGICVDVYRDSSRKELVSMLHGLQMYNTNGKLDAEMLQNAEMLQTLMESIFGRRDTPIFFKKNNHL